MLLCVEKQDAANAKKVFNAVHTRWPIGHGNLRKNYYYLLYQVEDHEEIIKGFNSCPFSERVSVDEENSLYIATLYKIGKSQFGKGLLISHLQIRTSLQFQETYISKLSIRLKHLLVQVMAIRVVKFLSFGLMATCQK